MVKKNERPRVWSGRVNKWVWATKTRSCPKCGENWGGARDGGFTPGDQYDPELKNAPKKLCPGCYRE